VGGRAQSQTTVVWVRGILQPDCGVRIGRIQWVAFEDGHVAEYREAAASKSKICLTRQRVRAERVTPLPGRGAG
jgi:hypothetical protein